MREDEEPVAGFLESLRIRGRHPDTVAAYGRKLRHFTGYLSDRGQSVVTAGATILREYFMAVKEEGHAASTVWGKRHAVYALYEYLRENAFLLLNPCPEVVCESENRLPRPVPRLAEYAGGV